MPFFMRDYTVRRFVGMSDEFTEFTATMDVQQVVPSSSEFAQDGQRKRKSVNTWGAVQMLAADPVTGTRGDLLLYKGHWYECTSCENRDHTILRHWRGEWTRQPEGSEGRDNASAKIVLTPTG